LGHIRVPAGSNPRPGRGPTPDRSDRRRAPGKGDHRSWTPRARIKWRQKSQARRPTCGWRPPRTADTGSASPRRSTSGSTSRGSPSRIASRARRRWATRTGQPTRLSATPRAALPHLRRHRPLRDLDDHRRDRGPGLSSEGCASTAHDRNASCGLCAAGPMLRIPAWNV
jgi:hypothetical protein